MVAVGEVGGSERSGGGLTKRLAAETHVEKSFVVCMVGDATEDLRRKCEKGDHNVLVDFNESKSEFEVLRKVLSDDVSRRED
jgi:hypothetical protein